MRQIASSVALVAASLAALVPAVAAAAPGFDLQVGAFVDDQEGASYDLNALFRPSDSLTFSLGAGRSSSSLATTEFKGTTVRGGADLRRGRFGAGVYASNWEDSDQLTSQVLGGRLSMTFGETFDVALLAESRQLGVTYTTTGPRGRAIAQDVRFDGAGLGAELGWIGNAWSGYLRGISYDYDAQLDRAINASRAPSTRAFPRAAALVNSVLTRTAGAIDYQASLGVDRAFSRAGLGADLTLTSDVISGAGSTSLSLSWRYDLTTQVGIDATLGMTETDGFDSIGFAGVGFSFRN